MRKLFFLLALFSAFYLQAQVDDAKVIEFTKNNYLQLISSLPQQQLNEFGFENKDEIYHLQFVKVLAEYSLINGNPVKTNNYRVLTLNENGSPRGFFTIFFRNSQPEVADFGALELSKTIFQSLAKFDATSHISILRIFSTQSDYLFDDKLPFEKQDFLKVFENNFYSLNNIKTN